jgi:hypothetical protein
VTIHQEEGKICRKIFKKKNLKILYFMVLLFIKLFVSYNECTMIGLLRLILCSPILVLPTSYSIISWYSFFYLLQFTFRFIYYTLFIYLIYSSSYILKSGTNRLAKSLILYYCNRCSKSFPYIIRFYNVFYFVYEIIDTIHFRYEIMSNIFKNLC